MVKAEKFQKELAIKDYELLDKSYKSKIKGLDRTIKSNHFLIKDLWEFVQKFDLKKADRDLKRCKLDLSYCKERVGKALEFVTTKKVVRESQPMNNFKEAVKVTAIVKSVDVYA
jgi:hypothetical protein